MNMKKTIVLIVAFLINVALFAFTNYTNWETNTREIREIRVLFYYQQSIC